MSERGTIGRQLAGKAALITGAVRRNGRAGTPEDVAAAVLFACLPGSSFITGQTLHVNGGRFLP